MAGDLNVAASQRDVHAKLCWADMYGAEEKAEMAALLSALPDVWRLRHPDACNAFTVQDCGVSLWHMYRKGCPPCGIVTLIFKVAPPPFCYTSTVVGAAAGVG